MNGEPEDGAVAAALTEARCCGARLRRGGHCALPPSPGKRRCFQHGGARGIGAPKGNDNAFKHGFFTEVETAEQDCGRDGRRGQAELAARRSATGNASRAGSDFREPIRPTAGHLLLSIHKWV
jgi:hypothetical protein